MYLITSLLLASFSVLAVDPKVSYKLLSDSRSEITLPATTLADRELIMDQVNMVLNDLFIHRELKIKNHGIDADPTPIIKELEKNLAKVSEEELHGTLSLAFQKLRDWHTTYHLPKPYSCHRAFIPFSFKPVKLNDGATGLGVSQLATEEVLKLVPGLPIKAGDKLVSFNGMTPEEALKSVRLFSRGANDEAAIRYGADSLTFISLKTDLLPDSNEVKLELENIMGQKYEVTVPYIVRTNLDCLKPAKTSETGIKGANEYQIDFNDTYKPSKKNFLKSRTASADELKDTAEPVLKYKTITNNNGKFGYLKLTSFIPVKLETSEVIAEVKKLLEGEFKETDGLIYDIRGNGGGYIKLAENMVQLFTPNNIKPLNFRLKNSLPNQHYWFNSEADEAFIEALKNAIQTNSPVTTDTAMNTVQRVNEIGQSYFKPVAVFTDANCYSSCDMFSALMQDFGAATLFGEDSTTGAGGANNWNLNEMISDLPEGKKGPFKKLPNEQNIGFSLRQTVRVGMNAGKLIEDVGVLSDRILPATLEDLRNKSSKQLETITEYLSKQSPKYQSKIQIENGLKTIQIGKVLTVAAQWSNTDTMKFLKNGKVIEERSIEVITSSGELVFPSEISSGAPTMSQIEVIGESEGKRVWRKVISYKTTPVPFTLTDQKLTLSSMSPAIYNFGSLARNGWNISGESLSIGPGDKYKNNVRTYTSVFLKTASERKLIRLSFDVKSDTEKDYDFFDVVVRVNGKESKIYTASGKFEEANKTLEIPLTEISDVEISFSFESDGSSVGEGVSLSNIRLE